VLEVKTLASGLREFIEDSRDDRRRDEERSDSRREDQRRDEMSRRREEDERQRREDERRRQEALIIVVNDDDIEISPEERKIINNPDLKMMSNGEVVRRNRRGLGSGAFAAQFSVLRGQLPKVKRVVKSKARKELNKLQSKAFRMANEKLRTKAGKLRKGVTQKDVAKLAQRILKKLRK